MFHYQMYWLFGVCVYGDLLYYSISNHVNINKHYLITIWLKIHTYIRSAKLATVVAAFTQTGHPWIGTFFLRRLDKQALFFFNYRFLKLKQSVVYASSILSYSSCIVTLFSNVNKRHQTTEERRL